MTRLAITGHRGLPADTERLIDTALRDEIQRHAQGQLVGLTALADGADTLFARAILDACGSLIAIVPAQQYRDGLPEPHHPTYDALYAQAADTITLDHVESDSEAHMDGSRHMLDAADRLLAVWDRQPARGYGGTADVVQLAHDKNIPVTIIWPHGAHRD